MGKTIPESRKIDQKAQKLFYNAIPDDWLVRPQNPDVHIDYIVEIVENGEPSGIHFGVQLKGAKKTNRSKTKKAVSYSFKVKPLVYFLEKTKFPVFIVLVNITEKKGHWLFLQKFLKEIEINKPEWRNKGTLYISIPLINELENTTELYNSVKKSEEYMKNLWPGTIYSAVQNEKKQLENLDSRVHIDVNHINSQTIFSLIPKENFTLDMSIDRDKIDSLTEAVNKGSFVRFNTQHINITGSKLVDEILEKSKFVEFSFGQRRKADIILNTVDKSGNENNTIINISGDLICGRKEIRFEGAIPNSLEINFSVPIEKITNQAEVDIQLKFNPSWEGKLIEILPYFDKLYSFIQDIAQGHSVKLSCEIQGNYLFGGSFSTDADLWKSTEEFLSVISKARFISKSTNAKFTYPPKGMTDHDIETILILYNIIKNGEYKFSAEGIKITANLLPTEGDICTGEGDMQYKTSDKLTLLGKKLPWYLIVTFTHIRLLTDVSNTKRNKVIPLEWKGLSKAEGTFTISEV